jgi:peptide-methionine (S)-S-oxide reductase
LIVWQTKKLGKPVVSEIAAVANYNPAEAYHQQYLARGGRFGKPQDASKGCQDEIRCYG